MLRTLFSALLLSCVLSGAGLAQTPPSVEVPTFPNATCPIMGKKVSLPLFVDTELGRIYVCCKPCFKKIRANVPVAHKTAYPVVEELANTTCPVSGEPIGEDAVAVTLQGFRFRVCCEGCVVGARENSQVVLTKLRREKIVDVGNRTCPISAKPVQAHAFALVGTKLIHLAGPELVEQVSKDPQAALAKAEEIAAAQPPAKKHEHVREKKGDTKREKLEDGPEARPNGGGQ
ncbi:MAG: hypothetical protein JNM84_28300 [Planctomycetes bacterium]|nr:hypothetical protein [Planctomycetota bacterium]